MKRQTLFLLLAIAGGRLFAQVPSGYYDGATGMTGAELRQALHDIIDDHTTISYGQIWNAFWSTDNKGDNVVWDMYSDGANYTYYYTNGDDQCGSYDSEGDCYNREHSWPKSWFSGGEDGVPGRDLHHIFPTDGYVNQGRSNYPFGEVRSGSGVTTYKNGSKLGPCKSDVGYTGTVFEPIDEYKGDFARAYFYMCTRYYGEDSDWGSSGMTTKANLKDWAVTMLLHWSDNDPVSQKEIDRNNAVYDIQGNRNPFIDHPEYAHIIWEPGWMGVTYNIACASVQHGTITAPSSAMEGTIVTLTAIPATGYMLGSWNVYKTGDTSTTVTVSSNGTFTMPSFNVTVSATFVENNTYYTITKGSVSHGDFTMSANSALSGSTITLSASPANGYVLYDWYVYKTGDINTHVAVNKSGNTGSFTMPAFNVTVLASFAQGSGSGNYEKVTSIADVTSGSDYLIVCEANNLAFNGTVASGWGRCTSVTITNHTIESNSTTNGYKVVITSSGSGYTFLLPSGKYMSWTSRDFAESTNAVSYAISIANGTASISNNSYILQYNSNSGNGGLRSYTNTNQTAIQLYKKTSGSASTPTHTIHFNSNGGQGTMNDQNVNEFEPTALNTNTFTRQGYAFDSWNTAASGSGTTYFDGATVSLLSDLTLYAQWNPLFSVTCATVQHGSLSASYSTAVEGTLVTLTATPDAGYDFDYWVVTAGNDPVEVEGDQFVMPASNVNVSAVFSYVGQTYTQKYYLVTDASQLVEGRTYLIVCGSKKKAMSTQNDNDRASVQVTISNNVIANNQGACEITLGTSGDYWTLYDPAYGNAGGYLCAGSNSGNQLKTQTSLDNHGKWNIVIGASGTTIESIGGYTNKYLKYGSNGGYFGCFGSNQGTEVSLFIRSEECDFTESKTVASINTFDKNTIHSGVTLAVENVLGKTMCNNASQLVLEDGAQLVHTEIGLNGTMKKIITAWSDNGGWYTIAAPFASLTPSANNGLIANDYDLYSYDEDASLEWVNYKAGNFNLASGQGYLYAHNPTATLRMSGTLNSGTYSATVNLSYGNSDANLKGWNLLGNPTAHDISFTKSTNVSDGYYYLNNSENWEYETSNTVPVVRGFLVKANATEQSVTLNPQSKGSREEKGQYLCLSIGEEKAYVKLNEGVSMPLMDLNGQHSNLYLMRESKPYVMLVRNKADALDLCFEARQEGTQTLTVDTQGLDLDYLHLIDHKTGADVDLLATPSYVFEASADGYATRFRLAFAPMDGPSTGSENFAYWADGEIRLIAEPQGIAILQVMDLTGRILVSRDAARHVSTIGMTPGVYVLRLATDDNVRVQKIVVK